MIAAVRLPIVVLALISSALLTACARELDDTTPEGAAALFVDALERGRDDRNALREAYELIDEESQRRLYERARSATALGAREYEPWEMLVEGRSRLRFTPRRGSGFRARDEGEGRAVVTVSGEEASQRAELPMQLEDDGWRVVLDVPELRSTPE
ncbi:Hypothetical protein I5071_7310 [Sandaracinus amylolyticus]|nr:Hypothetical protein I5071_7310 [Sandaracinus amylolyticus]